MTPARGVFIGQRKDRMGARLLMMLTCIRLAEDFDTDYRVNWFPQGADAPELDTPQELFDPAWIDTHFLDQKSYDTLIKTALPVWSFQGDKTPDRLLAHLAAGRSVLVEEGFEVLAFPWEDIETIRPRYRDFIHRIGFAGNIRAIMKRADARLSGQGVSAYHIRRGDILNGLPWKHTTWPAKIEPEELYEAHLDKMQGRPAIMFSDQPELISRFRKRYPQLMQMSDIADLSDLTRAQRDFLELYTMSRADQVIAPFISAFSMAAARVSGQQRVLFRDVLSEEEMARANERVIQRVARGAGAFLNASEAAHIYAKAVQSLGAQDRFEEAYDLGQPILQAGADNAFLPLLQALNAFYLGRWKESGQLAREGLENPHLWPEDHAVLCAVQAAVLGAQKKRWAAGRHFAKAFWAKPLRPDVIVLGSRMLYRDQLPFRLFPPADWGLQRQVRQRRFPPFNNLYLVQHKVIVRQPCNFDMILLDWSDLSLDQRARRLLDSPARLEALMAGVRAARGSAPDEVAEQSVLTLLEFHTGQLSGPQAIDAARRVAGQRPDQPLYHKRLAELYAWQDDGRRARLTMAEGLACDPDNPFMVFAMGQLLRRIGASGQGDQQILHAAGMEDATAAIQGAAGQIHLKRGNKAQARKHLERASALCPTYKRFSNQLKRVGG